MVGTVRGSSVDGVGLASVIIILKRSRGNLLVFYVLKGVKMIYNLHCCA